MIADIGPNVTYVLVALIGSVPAIIAAVYSGRVHAKIKTPSGKSIGEQVEDALHVVLANNMHLRVQGNVGERETAEASAATDARVARIADAESDAR